MRKVIAMALVVAAAALVPTLALGSASATTKLEAKLAGKNEVPKAGNGSGEALIQIAGTKVCWQFKDLKGVAGATASHIHKGNPGTSGPVVVPLGAAFKAAGCTSAPSSVLKAIAAHPGQYYVNVHTPKYPGGAARGQLEPSM